MVDYNNTRDYKNPKQPKLSLKKEKTNSIYPQNYLQAQNNKRNSRVKKRKKGSLIKRVAKSIKDLIRKIKSVFGI